jgi:sulfite exporter TauE/SafE
MEAVLGIFVASLVGSPHCAAMCGPFLAFAAAGSDARSPRWIATGSYHGGRLVSYVGLGIVAGSLGAGVERLGGLAGVSRAAAIVAGMLMVAWGADTILALRGHRSRFHPPPALQRALGSVTRRVTGLPGTTRAFVTGAATALLPCGWLYAFVAAAGGTGSPARAALVMLFFWTGTLPVMAALGLGLQRLSGPLRKSLPLVTASVVVAIGLLTIAGRLRPTIATNTTHGAHVSAQNR